MDIVDGKLIPASAWDAERLSTYRPRLDARGNLIAPRVSVVITQEVASWARRRYWAILGVVVKTCQLPPRVRTTQDLHDAVRKQIGFVDSHSSDGKTLTVKLRSTKKLDDQEFEAFAAEAYNELSEMTGVDVMTLGKEAPDVGRDETEQPEGSSPSSTSGSGSSGGPADPHSAAADQSAGAADQEGDSDAEADESPSDTDADRVRRLLMEECAENFIRDATSLPKEERQAKIDKLRSVWKGELKDQGRFVDICHRSAEKLIANPGDKPAAEKYLRGLVK